MQLYTLLAVLRELLLLTKVFEMPFLTGDLRQVEVMRLHAKDCEESLAEIIKAVAFRRVRTRKEQLVSVLTTGSSRRR